MERLLDASDFISSNVLGKRSLEVFIHLLAPLLSPSRGTPVRKPRVDKAREKVFPHREETGAWSALFAIGKKEGMRRVVEHQWVTESALRLLPRTPDSRLCVRSEVSKVLEKGRGAAAIFRVSHDTSALGQYLCSLDAAQGACAVSAEAIALTSAISSALRVACRRLFALRKLVKRAARKIPVPHPSSVT